MEPQEIELIDYLNVIWRRKGLILGGTLLAALTALGVSLSIPKSYEISRTLKIGQVQGKAVEGREALSDRLQDQRMLAALIQEFQLNTTPAQINQAIAVVRHSGKPNPHFRYTVEASDPRLAARMADWLAERIVARHKEVLDQRMQLARAYEADLAAAISGLEAEAGSMKRRVRALTERQGSDQVATILLNADLYKRQERIQGLRRELQQFRLSLLPPDSENTRVISADVLAKGPIKPRTKVNVAMAGVLGLMMFTFLGFFVEYLKNSRRD